MWVGFLPPSYHTQSTPHRTQYTFLVTHTQAMTRSKEALIRRAEKRGLPVPEFIRSGTTANGRSRNMRPEKKLKTEISTEQSISQQSPSKWVCSKCNNKNLVSLALNQCNRCQRPRAEVDESYASATSKRKVDESNTASTASKKKQEEVEKKRNIPAAKDRAKKLGWDIIPATQEEIRRNQALREAFCDEELRKNLSESELARAEVLIARSKRKKIKKKRIKYH